MEDALRPSNRASTPVLAAVARGFAGSRVEGDVLSRVYELVHPPRAWAARRQSPRRCQADTADRGTASHEFP